MWVGDYIRILVDKEARTLGTLSSLVSISNVVPKWSQLVA